ncbi:MAG: 16S rRNA processing protein RimM [Chitinophagaceae bacterium]|nr:16S rRNA processing protein RimM [Chitinophagaceae bacterium]
MEYISIGRIVAVHGVAGRMILKHALGKRSKLDGVEAVFTKESTGSFIPWFLTATTASKSDETYIELDGITTREAASRLLGKEIWLKEEDFKRLAGKNAPISFLGYEVMDGGNLIGRVDEIIEMPYQLLCKVMWQGVEVLIPVNEEFLKGIDKKNKILHMELPDGLLDVYKS